MSQLRADTPVQAEWQAQSNYSDEIEFFLFGCTHTELTDCRAVLSRPQTEKCHTPHTAHIVCVDITRFSRGRFWQMSFLTCTSINYLAGGAVGVCLGVRACSGIMMTAPTSNTHMGRERIIIFMHGCPSR